MTPRLKVGVNFLRHKDDELKEEVEYVVKYANKDAVDEAGAESDDDDDMSSVGSFGDEEDEPAGTMEEV
jgi:hypothetical protein